MTLRRFLLLSLFLLSLALAPAESVTNHVEQVLSVFASSEFSRKDVLDRAAFRRTALHEETTYIVTDKASRKYTLVFISKAGGWATNPQGKKVEVISKEIALCDYKTGEVLLSINNPYPLQKGVDVSEYGSFAVQEFIGKVKADRRVSLEAKSAGTLAPPTLSSNELKIPKASGQQRNSWDPNESDSKLKQEFDYLNNAYFDGKLKIFAIYWSDVMKPMQLGVTHWWQESGMIKVALNSNISNMAAPETRKQVLLHEMCHVASFMWDKSVASVSDNHKAESFKEQMARLNRLGLNPWPY